MLCFAPVYAEINIDLGIIRIIESDNNPLAFNRKTKCYGLFQISEICLADYNQLNNTNYEPANLLDPLLNEKIAAWYFKRLHQLLSHYKIPVTVTTLLVSYNWGIGNVADWFRGGAGFGQLPKATQVYVKKYLKLARTAE